MRVETIYNSNSSGEIVNAAADETVLLLRRMVKMMESNTVIDANMRQRVIVDGAVISSGTVTTVGTVTTLNQLAGIDARWQFLENARLAYNTGIRSQLSF